MNSQCCDMTPISDLKCYYIPPIVNDLKIRKTKKGKWQVQINGKGKWVNAEYNEQTHTLKYTA